MKRIHVTGFVQFPIDMTLEVGASGGQLDTINEMEQKIEEAVKMMAGLGRADYKNLHIRIEA